MRMADRRLRSRADAALALARSSARAFEQARTSAYVSFVARPSMSSRMTTATAATSSTRTRAQAVGAPRRRSAETSRPRASTFHRPPRPTAPRTLRLRPVRTAHRPGIGVRARTANRWDRTRRACGFALAGFASRGAARIHRPRRLRGERPLTPRRLKPAARRACRGDSRARGFQILRCLQAESRRNTPSNWASLGEVRRCPRINSPSGRSLTQVDQEACERARGSPPARRGTRARQRQRAQRQTPRPRRARPSPSSPKRPCMAPCRGEARQAGGRRRPMRARRRGTRRRRAVRARVALRAVRPGWSASSPPSRRPAPHGILRFRAARFAPGSRKGLALGGLAGRSGWRARRPTGIVAPSASRSCRIVDDAKVTCRPTRP